MNKKLERVIGSTGVNNAFASIIAIVIGLIFGFLVLMISDADHAVEGVGVILTGGFSGGGRGIGQVLYFATPLIMTGLSVGCAFKTGLFNIGASGQFIMGGAVAIYVGCYWGSLGSIHWVVAILAAAIAGGLWGALPGILKAFFNVHEVISTIMMNYIGMYMANYIIRYYAYNTNKNLSKNVMDSAVIPRFGLDKIFKTHIGDFTDLSTVNGGFILAVAMAIIMYILFYKTTIGYELMAVGHNPDASKYTGINSKKSVVLSMVIAGMLAGIGGAFLYLSGPTGRHIQVVDVLAPEGFNGISVALLGLSNPIGIIFSSLFIGYLSQGGTYLQGLNYMPEVIEIIIAIIIYFSAFSLILRQILPNILKRMRRGEKVQENRSEFGDGDSYQGSIDSNDYSDDHGADHCTDQSDDGYTNSKLSEDNCKRMSSSDDGEGGIA